MMQLMLCRGQQVQTGSTELLQQWQTQTDSWLWVDLYGESASEEKAFLTEQFEFDEFSVSEAQRTRHPPSFEVFENYLFLLLKPLDAESDSLDFGTLQLAMFAGERLLVTRHSKESPYLARLWQDMVQHGYRDETPFSVVSAMCMRTTWRYGKVLLDLEQRLDEIEDELFSSPTDTLMKELVGYNTGLRKMHRILSYYEDIFAALHQHLRKIKHPDHEQFHDIYTRIERFNSLSAMYQNVITDLIEGYISLNGHRLNQIMKVLTIVTVIFVPLTLLVGIYGMNFENMPELKSKHGYYILLTVMSSIAVLLLYLFRRVRWL